HHLWRELPETTRQCSRAASRHRHVDDHRRVWSHARATRARSFAARALHCRADGGARCSQTAALSPAWCAQRRRQLRTNRRRAFDRQSASVIRRMEKDQGALANGSRRVDAGQLMFIDRAVVRVVGGTGGSGASSFARFKYKPKGGPDGGDGGNGGSVYVRADGNLATLLDYRYRTEWKAERGEHGKGKTQTGASTEDVYLPVPPGTVVSDADTGQALGELLEPRD